MPNKHFQVYWTSIAESDLVEIIDFISIQSKTASKKILSRIKLKTSQLKSTPHRGRIVPEFNQFNITSIREVIISPWRIFYKIDREFVYILAVIDCRRNVEDIILNRLLRIDNDK